MSNQIMTKVCVGIEVNLGLASPAYQHTVHFTAKGIEASLVNVFVPTLRARKRCVRIASQRPRHTSTSCSFSLVSITDTSTNRGAPSHNSCVWLALAHTHTRGITSPDTCGFGNVCTCVFSLFYCLFGIGGGHPPSEGQLSPNGRWMSEGGGGGGWRERIIGYETFWREGVEGKEGSMEEGREE